MFFSISCSRVLYLLYATCSYSGSSVGKISTDAALRAGPSVLAELLVLLSCVGKVYNITPYLDFHPGGVADLMRGAGIDCSELFDEVLRRLSACIVPSVL